jgi:hypothetical protein
MYDTPLAKRNSILVVAVSARIGAATTGRVTAKGSRERIPCSTLKLRPHTSLYCQDKGFVLQNMSHSNQGPPHTAMWLCAQASGAMGLWDANICTELQLATPT